MSDMADHVNEQEDRRINSYVNEKEDVHGPWPSHKQEEADEIEEDEK